MANEPQKNQNWQPTGGWKAPQNKNALIIAGTVIILLGIYFATRDNTQVGVQKETATEESSNTSAESKVEENKGETAGASTEKAKDTMIKDAPKESMTGSSKKISITGTLKASDNSDKGNLMLSTTSGSVYIRTNRDFSSLMDTVVTLTGTGTSTAFVLDNITNQSNTAATTDTTAKGGDTDAAMMEKKKENAMEGKVELSGKLGKSDTETKGNYMIINGATKIYIATSKDYSNWVGSEVNLSAEGTLASFSKAMLEKK